MIDWKETSNRFIAFIDIMGFSNYVYRNEHSVVKKRMNKLQSILEDTEKKINDLKKDTLKSESIKSVIFSDSILLITKGNSEDDLKTILFTCQVFLTNCIIDKIPIKGAISYGTLTADFNKSLFFGKALIDSYNLQEELFMYGIVLDYKIEKQLLKKKDAGNGYCIQCKTPTKSGNITHYNIDWMCWHNTMNDLKKIKDPNDVEKLRLKIDKPTAIKAIQEFYTDMSGYPRKYLDNTIDFINNASA
ncbi:hypothetical protein [Thalassobellus suaedae]|uniref:Guanylate cyclase domain-containing protein n=1 Tax=Thalassobellus suaedae TaxID=3074124 RepID=A0ABY9XY16_9FLAO|nr:hypothetical protein RHP51_09545 [Flavobacteriaceae bacterium HL-DH14]